MTTPAPTAATADAGPGRGVDDARGRRTGVTLETMTPDPAFDPDAHADTVAALGAPGLVFRVWGGDWCPDCRRALPAFAAALDAAGVPADRIEISAVERGPDGGKVGPGVERHGIEFVPTVVVERDGTELARFVEGEADGRPIAAVLADRLSAATDDA